MFIQTYPKNIQVIYHTYALICVFIKYFQLINHNDGILIIIFTLFFFDECTFLI